MQFLYRDGTDAHFMDTESYEQLTIPEATLADALRWMKESDEVELLYIDDEPADVQLPSAIDLAVAETEPGRARRHRLGRRDQAGRARDRGADPGAAVRQRRRRGPGRHALGRVRLARLSGACVGPSSDAPRSGRSTRATCSGGRWRRRFPRDAHAFTRALAQLVREHQPELDELIRELCQRLVAGADRAAGALDPARRAGRAAAPRRAARGAGDPARGGDRRGRGDRQAVLRRRGAGVRQRDPRRRCLRERHLSANVGSPRVRAPGSGDNPAMRLLVVDDDRALRDVLRRALTLSGYEVRLAETGAEALAEVTAGRARRDGARHRAARHRRPRGVPAAAAGGQSRAGPDADRARCRLGPDRRARRRRRRLPGQAVRHRRAQGAAAGAAAARRRRGRRRRRPVVRRAASSIRPATG